MISYYTSIILLCCLTLGVMSVLVSKNNRIGQDEKKLLYLTYALIAAAALSEWCGVQLDGRASLPGWMLRIVKCLDYILTPMAGGALVLQMKLRNRWQKTMIGIIIVNTVFQIIASFFGWTAVIDTQNHYVHGPLFPAYMGVCFAIYVLVMLQFKIYGESYKRQNRMSLYAVMLLVMAGILLQELQSDVRTAYIGMTIGAALMFIHYTEFSQLQADDHIARQQQELQTDPLTNLKNRYAYSNALKRYSAVPLPGRFAAFSIDINDMKRTNDTLGHEAGDELLRIAADCIGQVFRENADCFRTGGDEFVILATETDRDRAEEDLMKLKARAALWKGSVGQQLTLAAGYALACDHPTLNAEALVRESDLAMYKKKAEFYRSSGRDRRARPRE